MRREHKSITMISRKPKTVPYRRKREQKTNYAKRLKLLHSGKKRLVVRFSSSKVLAQLVEFTPKGDKVLVGTDSFALRKYGWPYSCKNFPAAYLTGLLFGKKMKEKKFTEMAVLDTGFRMPQRQGKIYAFLKGVIDAGISIPHGQKEIFPDERRIQGRHVQEYADKVKGKGRQFTQYLKSEAAPENMPTLFAQVKQKITG